MFPSGKRERRDSAFFFPHTTSLVKKAVTTPIDKATMSKLEKYGFEPALPDALERCTLHVCLACMFYMLERYGFEPALPDAPERCVSGMLSPKIQDLNPKPCTLNPT